MSSRVATQARSRDFTYSRNFATAQARFETILPGLVGDIDGVLAALADYETNAAPDAWAVKQACSVSSETMPRPGSR